MRNGPTQPLLPNLSRMLRRALRAHEQGAFDKAERFYTAVLHIHPDHFDALHGLGLINYRRGRLDAALALIQAALQADLDRADGFSSLGLVFHALKQFERALKSYDEGLRLAPGDTEILNRRGVALLELGRPREALDNFERVLAADPDHLDALGNRGNALIKLNHLTEALSSYDKALTIAPDDAQLLTNRAAALRRLDRPHEAMMSARRALVSRPDFAQAKFVEGVARLTLGDFSGWRGYEARWGVGFLAAHRRSFDAPLWRGDSPLDGKTILLHAEQGFGDTLQFVRYAPLLAGRGANVVLEVQPELARLLSPLPGVAAVIARGKPLPRFDCHCPLMSLPLVFATDLATIPAQIPYVAAVDHDVALWRERLPRRGPLIGLVWSGERLHDNDRNRSLRLETLLPLLQMPDVTFVSLQHEVRDEDANLLQEQSTVAHVGDRLRDFADTAAVVSLLDAVISADTAVAHLAGAMGKPLLLLLPFGGDFRWLRERDDSPWYPTARLFRQPAFGDWASVIEALRRELMRADFSPRRHKLSA
jgi:tetratricopeptide (TPR) repeat protein